VAATKISGEENRYSGTDLSDFQANIDGSKKIVDVLRPLLQRADAALLAQVDGNFTRVDAILARYRTADGFQNYEKLSPGGPQRPASADHRPGGRPLPLARHAGAGLNSLATGG
jgi:iron uptake system EfeUOB component EfeO/EfeM